MTVLELDDDVNDKFTIYTYSDFIMNNTLNFYTVLTVHIDSHKRQTRHEIP
jgi:hypothetical protein